MIIKINSLNEHLLDILHKNPNTDFGLYAKTLKNGVLIGNCINQNNYEVLFQDSKYSYLPEDSNLIDFQSYCNPLVVLHICNEFFSTLLKSRGDYENQRINWLDKSIIEIDSEECEIEIPTFYIHSSWAKDGKFLLSKYFPNVAITHLVGKNFKLNIKAKTIYEAINLLVVISVFTHLTNNYGIYTFIDDSFAEKYARILTNIKNVPYFVFYLFIKKATKTEKQFELIKPNFEKYLKEQDIEAELTFYHTHLARINFISNQISGDFPILDMGCGEFIYFKKFKKRGFSLSYFAIDSDEQFASMAENIKIKYEADNLLFFNSLERFEAQYNNEKIDILLTEVIEHNSLEEAKILIDKLLQFDINQLIITTPNSDFNSFYFENVDEFRHDDHHFELSNIEFIEFIKTCNIANKTLKFTQIGDKLNGIQPTQVCIIK